MNTNITVTFAQFLADFPEFDTSLQSNPNAPEFASSQFNYYFNLAQILVDPRNRAGSMINALAELFIAHHLVLETLSMREMNAGGVPGVAKGPIAGKSAGDVQISYVPGATLELGAGNWNYSVYGQRFIRLAWIVGTGPIQVGPCGSGGPNNGPGWPGPLFWDSF